MGAQGGGEIVGRDGVLRETLGDGYGVGVVGAGVGGGAVDGEERGGALGDVDLLVVGAGIYEDALGGGARGGEGVDGGLDLGNVRL